jgi:UDP-N-acetylmuramyl pentapeptide phosphotransferase/UDP-N-acetylglucosamine-1-phosphate transferase
MTFTLILAFSSFLLSLLGTRLVILAFRNRVVSPDSRGLRQTPIADGGGIAVVMALIICLLVADINYGIVLGMFLLAAVSLLGDIIDVPLPIHLLIHLLAVLIPVSVMTHPVFGGLLPLWMDKTLTVILWMWFISLFNLMDGIDGIAPTEMICIGGGLVLITALTGIFPNPLSTYSLVFASAAWGFLWWNWHPAKILLGEVGSTPIGYLLGYLLYLAILSGYGYAAAILPAYYLSDATITLIRRIYQGQNILEAHSQHYYQLAVRKGRRHESVVRYIFGVNLLLIFLATFSVLNPDPAIYCLAMAYMCVFMILGFFAYTAHNHRHEPF